MTRLAALTLLVACGGSAPESGGRATAPLDPTTRDSAGVSIHEHPADALERAPLITVDSVALAVFRGDALDPGRDVSTIWYLTFTTSGDLVGYERGERQFVVLRLADRSQRRYGRSGSGPMELGYVRDFVALEDDTVAFGDQSNNRLVIAHPDTGVVRTISLTKVGGLPGKTLITWLGDSVVLLAGRGGGMNDGPPESGVVDQHQTLLMWSVAADSIRQLATIGDGKRLQAVFSGGAPGMWTATFRGLALAGDVYLKGWDGQFAVAGGGAWQLERWDTAGHLRTVIRVTRAARMVDDDLLARAVEAELATSAGRDSTLNLDSARSAIRARPHSDTVGVFGGMHPTTNGRVWLIDYRLPGDSGWAATAVDLRGRILGRIVAPTGDPPVAFGNDRLAFRTEDDDGIATITVRKLNLP